jgi:hypothetical protein
MPDESLNDNPKPQPTPHFDEFSGKKSSASSFDMNPEPKPEPAVQPESGSGQYADVEQTATPSGTIPVGNGPMTSFSSNPSVPPEQSRILEDQVATSAVIDATPRKSKWYKSKKFIVGLIVAVIAVILLGGSAFAYVTYYQNPQKVISDSIIGAVTAKTSIYTGDITFSNSEGKATIKVTSKTADAVGSVDIKFSIETNGKTYSIGGSGLMDKSGNLYFKLSDLAGIVAEAKSSMGITAGSSTSLAIDKLVKRIDGVWVKISSEDLKKYSTEMATTQTCMNDTIKKFKDDKVAIDEVTDLYDKNQFVIVAKDLGQVDSNLGYQVKVSGAKLKAYLDSLKGTAIYKSLHDCDDTFTIDTSGMSTKDGPNDSTTIKLWANMWNHQIAKLEVNSTDSGNTLNATILPQFNQTVDITAPSSSISLAELQSHIEELFSSFSGIQQDL